MCIYIYIERERDYIISYHTILYHILSYHLYYGPRPARQVGARPGQPPRGSRRAAAGVGGACAGASTRVLSGFAFVRGFGASVTLGL